MDTDSNEKRLIDVRWLQFGLLLAVALVVWWLRRRKPVEAPADRLVIWRRGIEMGPDAPGARKTSPEIEIEETAVEEADEQPGAVPEVQAGDGEIALEQAAPEAGELPASADDLQIIEGIGPKISRILQDAGIHTFARLAETDPAQVEQILRAAGLRLADPATWGEQARMAADGAWSKLEAFQKSLKGGRRA